MGAKQGNQKFFTAVFSISPMKFREVDKE